MEEKGFIFDQNKEKISDPEADLEDKEFKEKVEMVISEMENPNNKKRNPHYAEIMRKVLLDNDLFLSFESSNLSQEIDRAKSPAELDLEINGPISQGNLDLLKVEKEDRLSLGRMVFLHHCNSCHAAEHGYSAVAPMISGKSAAELKDFAMRLNHSHFYMPPWSGVEVEAELLGEYLESLGAKVPNNVFMKDKPKKERVVEETTTDAEAESTHSATPTPSEDANAELLE